MRLLDLNAELLAHALDLSAPRDPRLAATYGVVRAPTTHLALVCRRFRDLLQKPLAKRILCVPLLRADADWAAYFARYGDGADELRLFSSRSGPHSPLDSPELTRSVFRALDLCLGAMPPQLQAKITLLELSLAMPTLYREHLVDKGEDDDIDEMIATQATFSKHLNGLSNLRRVVVRIAAPPNEEGRVPVTADEVRAMARARRLAYNASFKFVYHAVRARPDPLDELVIEVEDAATLDLHTYAFLLLFNTTIHHGDWLLSVVFDNDNALRWHLYDVEPRAEYPVHIRRVRLPDFGDWEGVALSALALLRIGALEFTGTHVFRPRLTHAMDLFGVAHLARTTPMTLAFGEGASVRAPAPLLPWLRVLCSARAQE